MASPETPANPHPRQESPEEAESSGLSPVAEAVPPAPPSPTETAEEALLADFDRYIRTDDPTPAPAATVDASTEAFLGRLDRLARRFPHSDRDVLHSVLVSCDGDAAMAASMLGEAEPLTDEDERMALLLQRREDRHVAARHRRNEARVPPSKRIMQQMVDTLREIVVPALRAHFQELRLPDMRDRSGRVEYALSEFEVAGLSMPSDGIVVKAAADGQSVRVHVINVFLELEVGRWSYEGTGFVPMKDAGSARVTVHGMSVALRLEPRWSHSGGTKVVIADCSVMIDGAVRFKVHGAAADWAYNTIAVVLKPLVVSYIKDAVASTVTEALAVHLRQWAMARSLDEPHGGHRVIEEGSTNPRTPSGPSAGVTAAGE